MFETVAKALIPLDPALGLEGRSHWEFMSRPTNVAWLQVEFADIYDAYDSWGVHFFNDVQQILDMFWGTGMTVRQFDLVARAGPGKPWQMHRVYRTWWVESHGGREYALELANGSVFLTRTDQFILGDQRIEHFSTKALVFEA
jgi:hypothetical protein